MKPVIASLLILSTTLAPGRAVAYTEAELMGEFDARVLSESEKRFLQAALALTGDYTGMIDGAWGRGSQAALERFAARELDTYDGIVPAFMAVISAKFAADEFDSEGWREKYFEPLDMSFLIPEGNLLDDQSSENFVTWNHAHSSLSYSVAVGNVNQMMGLHSYTLAEAAPGTEPYTVRKPSLFITTSKTSDGMALYTRSDLRGQTWSIIMLMAETQDDGLLAAVSGSIRIGPAPPIYFPTGKLSRGWEVMQASVAKDDANVSAPGVAPSAPAAPADPPAENGPSSGTGFVVSATGDVLTNAHVVEDCARITIDSIPMTLVAADTTFDLALLRSPALAGAPVASFAANPALLNSDVTVAGYPLAGLLGGLNVTRGAVTSLKGMAGDTTTMQISAPVQPGNSGGPVLNADGHVVGVVVSKLDVQFALDTTGDIPQNVNFAIRGEIAKLFLVQNGVLPVSGAQVEQPAPEQIAQSASGFTKFISCN